MLTLALVGLGEQALSNLIPSLLNVKSARLQAVCDVDEKKIQDVHQLGLLINSYTDYKELLSKERIDVIFVACPPQVHVEVATYAMQRGIHVFVEKPPAETTAQLRSMISLAEQFSVKSGVGLNFRYASPYKKIQSIITTKQFGKPRYIDIQHLANKPKEPMWQIPSAVRSFLLAQAIHPLDLLVSQGTTITTKHIDFIRTDHGFIAVITISIDNDAMLGTITTGSLFPYFETQITIRSDMGTVVTLDSLWNVSISSPYLSTNFTEEPKRWSLNWNPSPLDSGYRRSGYLGEIQAFLDAILHDQDFEPSFESQLKVYELIDEIEAEYQRQFGTLL